MIRPMSPDEYARFYKLSRDQQAADLIKSEGISREQATLRADEELAQLLPEGIDTPGHSLMCIAADDGSQAGYIWYMYEECEDVQQVFLCDLMIFPAERRKGYARAAIACMERDAHQHGCTESVLFVDSANMPAQSLYSAQGYATLRAFEGGVYMKKAL